MIKIDGAICLYLDKRLVEDEDNWGKIRGEIQDKFQVTPQLFLAGDGSLYHIQTYDYIDTPTLPPRIPGGTNYATWYKRPNAYNAFRCHKLMLNIAKLNQWENVLLIEDDIRVECDIKEIVDDAIKDIPKDWDMIYFGSYHNDHSYTRLSTHLLKAHGCAGFHAVLISHTIFNILLGFEPMGPYDEMCGKFIHPHFNCYCIHPSVITQKDGFSHIEGCHLSKPVRFIL